MKRKPPIILFQSSLNSLLDLIWTAINYLKGTNHDWTHASNSAFRQYIKKRAKTSRVKFLSVKVSAASENLQTLFC